MLLYVYVLACHASQQCSSQKQSKDTLSATKSKLPFLIHVFHSLGSTKRAIKPNV